MADKIYREAAEEEVQGWCELFEITIDLGTREKIVRALMAGRIMYDGKEESFTVHLRKPIQLESGDVIETLKLV